MLIPVYFVEDEKKPAHKAMVRSAEVDFFKKMGATTDEVDHKKSERARTVYWWAGNPFGYHKAVINNKDFKFFDKLGAEKYLEDVVKPEPKKEEKKVK